MRIAEALGLNYAFLCEFEELHSPLRDASSQGGALLDTSSLRGTKGMGP